MSRRYDIPGASPLELELEHLLLDVNGTLTDRGVLIDRVADRLRSLARSLNIILLSADTFGTLDELRAALGVETIRLRLGEEKRRVVEARGAARCVAIGNGANDAPMLDAAALAIAIVGPEDAAVGALRAADVVCGSIASALELLLDERSLASTLRP